MSKRLGLKGVVLASVITLTGCGIGGVNASRYNFEGVIDGEYLKFTSKDRTIQPDYNHLLVKEKDGTFKEYIDYWWSDLKPDFIRTFIGGQVNQEFADEESQKKFQTYLQKILEAKKRS